MDPGRRSGGTGRSRRPVPGLGPGLRHRRREGPGCGGGCGAAGWPAARIGRGDVDHRGLELLGELGERRRELDRVGDLEQRRVAGAGLRVFSARTAVLIRVPIRMPIDRVNSSKSGGKKLLGSSSAAKKRIGKSPKAGFFNYSRSPLVARRASTGSATRVSARPAGCRRGSARRPARRGARAARRPRRRRSARRRPAPWRRSGRCGWAWCIAAPRPEPKRPARWPAVP